MIINKNVLINEFSKISKNFELTYFNSLSIDDKKELLLNLAKITANCLNSIIDVNNILFVNKNDIGIGGASFSFNENLIRIDKGLIENKIDSINFLRLLDNVIHETVHYSQKQNKLFLEHLSVPLPVPYRTSQPHELDAYDTSGKILDEISRFLDNELCRQINELKNMKNFVNNLEALDLMTRHYSKEPEDIEKQIQEMLPFYKNVETTEKLDEEGKLDIKISKFNQHIDAIFMNDEGIFGKLRIKDIDGVNKLNFTIKDDTCFINEIVKITNNNIYKPVTRQNKEKLVSLLSNIINVANKIELCNCIKYETNPVSIVDMKEDHDKFIEDVINGNIEISGIFKKVISEKQIEKTLPNHIDDR